MPNREILEMLLLLYAVPAILLFLILYALYASSRPALLPAICLLAVPWGTLLPAGRPTPLLAALWAAIALGFCVYFTTTREPENEGPPGGGYDDIYGIPAPPFPNELPVMRV